MYPVFPARLAWGAQAGPQCDVEIVTMASGHEVRNRRRSVARRRLVIPGTTRPAREARELLAFFRARGGAHEAFLFTDPIAKDTAVDTVVSALDIQVAYGDGVTKRYAPGRSEGRMEHFIVPNSLRVAVGGNTVSSSLYDFDEESGFLDFAAPPAAGEVITVGYSYRILVRFENTQLSVTEIAANAMRHDDIILHEVFA